ncbi:MAG TPA: hypothetical protein VJ964_10120 [Balneolaceae bacterium]|nr:hypothetical protein [Balneolaceae bacterium]
MTSLSRFTIIITLIFLPFSVIGQNTESKAPSDNDADQIINAISLGEQLDETAQEFHSQFEQNPLGLDPSQNTQMMDLFKKAFDKKLLLSDVKDSFEDNFKTEYSDSVLNWINRESSQKVLDTRKTYYTLQGIRQRVVNKYELEQHPPSDDRKDLMDSLAHSTQAAKSEVEANVTMFRAVVKAFSRLSDQRTFSDAQIEGFVGNYRNQISSQMDQEISNQLLVMYHGLDDDVLRKYIAFYNTEAGQWLTDSTTKSMQTAFDAAADRFLNSVDKMDSGK